MPLYAEDYIPSDDRFIKISETELYALKWPAQKKVTIEKRFQPIDGEIWRPVPGCEEIFSVSNFGRVKSKKRGKNGRFVEKILGTGKPGKRARVRLAHGNFVLVEDTARLVMKIFNPVGKMQRKTVIHLDGDSLNANLENLQWASPKEAREHQKQLGNIKPWLKQRETINAVTGKKTVWKARYSDADVMNMIRLFKANISPQKIAAIFGASVTMIVKFAAGEQRPEILEQFNTILEREAKEKKSKKGTEG